MPEAGAAAGKGAQEGKGKPSLFDPAAVPTRKCLRFLQRDPPERGYFIAFTPRSGSSWLCDLLTGTGRLGRPPELFNPAFVPRIAGTFGVPDLETYVEMNRRRLSKGGTFGFKITTQHAKRLLGGPDACAARFPELAPVFLIREDIVAQAVSTHFMRYQDRVHLTEDGAAPPVSDAPYDSSELRRFVDRNVAQEEAWEAAFSAVGTYPLRLSQERMLAMGRRSLIARFCDHVGVEAAAVEEAESRHRKIGTSRNAEFAARFREEEADYLAGIDARRAERLAALSI